jgi:hypothetical protein
LTEKGIDALTMAVIEGKFKPESSCGIRWNKPPFSLPNPIVYQVSKFWIKQKPARKIKQHFTFLVSLLAEIRLKEKEGTQRTFVRVNVAEILTVPIWVTSANDLLGNFTFLETVAVIDVKKVMELTMWSVAPVSMIQTPLWHELCRLCVCEAEKTECCEFKGKQGEYVGNKLPAILENMWSWVDVLVAGLWRDLGWIKASNFLHCSWEMDSGISETLALDKQHDLEDS